MDKEKTYNIRDLLAKLSTVSDLESEVCISISNSDPMPVTNAEENGEGQFVLTS